MKKLAFVVAAGALFALLPFVDRFGTVPAALATVWLGMLLAVFASGSIRSLAIAGGAVGAFASGVLSPAPTAAFAALVLFAFAERTLRVRSIAARWAHLALALVGGAAGGALVSAYVTATPSVFVVAVSMAAVLAALPLLIDADDPIAHALDQASALVSGPVQRALSSGAELRRNAETVSLDRDTAARVRTTWQSLVRLAEARIRLERTRPQALLRIARQIAEPATPSDDGNGKAPGSAPGAGEVRQSAELPTAAPADAPAAASTAAASTAAASTAADAVLRMVDQRIAEHVDVLARAYTAVDAARAARIGLDDAAVKTVASMGDSFDDVSRAIVEVRSDETLSTTSSS